MDRIEQILEKYFQRVVGLNWYQRQKHTAEAAKQIDSLYKTPVEKAPILTREEIKEKAGYTFSDKVWAMIYDLLIDQRDADDKHYTRSPRLDREAVNGILIRLWHDAHNYPALKEYNLDEILPPYLDAIIELNPVYKLDREAVRKIIRETPVWIRAKVEIRKNHDKLFEGLCDIRPESVDTLADAILNLPEAKDEGKKDD